MKNETYDPKDLRLKALFEAIALRDMNESTLKYLREFNNTSAQFLLLRAKNKIEKLIELLEKNRV